MPLSERVQRWGVQMVFRTSEEHAVQLEEARMDLHVRTKIGAAQVAVQTALERGWLTRDVSWDGDTSFQMRIWVMAGVFAELQSVCGAVGRWHQPALASAVDQFLALPGKERADIYSRCHRLGITDGNYAQMLVIHREQYRGLPWRKMVSRLMEDARVVEEGTGRLPRGTRAVVAFEPKLCAMDDWRRHVDRVLRALDSGVVEVNGKRYCWDKHGHQVTRGAEDGNSA